MDTTDDPRKQNYSLPAVRLGEPTESYQERYGHYINLVDDPSRYSHIAGKQQIRIYVDGVFDMFHFGHARYIMQAKNMFPNTWVIAGVSSGETTSELKGRTVMSEEERCESVRQCRYVDEVICPAPWCLTLDFLDKHNIDFVAQGGDPYPMGDVPDIYKPIKDAGRFLPVFRTNTVSTTELISRIIAEYDEFLTRNLERGFTRHDLGINILTEKRLRVKKRVEGVQKRIHDYVADFMAYFYEPVSHRIYAYLSEGEAEEEEEEETTRKEPSNSATNSSSGPA